MLIDINLLPKKEPKKFGYIIPIALLLILLILAAVYYYFQISSIKTNIDQVNKQISVIRKISDRESEKMNTTRSSNSVNQLKTGIAWADSNRIQTIPVMQELTSLLPERGFIQSFKYEETGTVTLTVQFDTPSEAAYYLDSLNKSKWIEKATLTSLNINSENNSDLSSGQTNTTNTVENQGLNNSTGTTAQSNLSSDTITNGATNKKNTDYVPRYIGLFEINLNKEMIRKMIKESNKDGTMEEGVTAP